MAKIITLNYQYKIDDKKYFVQTTDEKVISTLMETFEQANKIFGADTIFNIVKFEIDSEEEKRESEWAWKIVNQERINQEIKRQDALSNMNGDLSNDPDDADETYLDTMEPEEKDEETIIDEIIDEEYGEQIEDEEVIDE